MEEIIGLLAHFQEQLQGMNNDFQKIKDQVYDLYKENKNLKEENNNLKKLLFEDKNDDARKELKIEQHDDLAQLYEEGFHICHFNFGESREGDCLFCMGVLGEEDDEQEE
ncbi:MAG: initiation control protein YabA [Bacillota bacterium]